MPLQPNLEKKYVNNRGKQLPKKGSAEKAARTIKEETDDKTYGRPSSRKEQETRNRVARQQNYGNEKSQNRYTNTSRGKTSSGGWERTKTNFRNSAERAGLYNSNPNANPFRTMHESMYDGAIQTGNERRRAFANRTLREAQQDAFANTAGGRFLGNTAESLIDNSIVAAPYTFITGNKPTQTDFFRGQPESELTEEQRQRARERDEKMHTGIAAGAGRMAGMAINYGMARSAINPVLNRATDAVMNGTKVGQAIRSSSVLGQIGQAVGRSTAQDIGRGLVKESISDATLGFGQNALINYGEGLRGEDFWRQQAKDTALDFLVGGAMEGVGIGRQIRRAGKQADAINNIKISDILANANSKDEYLDALGEMSRPLKEQGIDIDSGRRLREASSQKGSEITNEYRKVLNMTDDEFLRYAGKAPAKETATETVENVAKNKKRTQGKTASVKRAETKAEYENRKTVEEQIRAENPDTYRAVAGRKLKKAPEETTVTVGDTISTNPTPEAKATVEDTVQTKVEETPVAQKAKTTQVESKKAVKEPTAKETTEAKVENAEVKAEEPAVKEEVKPTETKPEASNELPKKTDKPRAELGSRDGKETIIGKMREAGVELPDDPSNLTKKQLRALNDGTLSVEDANKIKGRRKSKKKKINLDEYDEISIQRNKSEEEIKGELIEKYIANKKELGEPLSESKIKELNGMNPEEVRKVIDDDAVTRGGYKDLDEYYADTLFRNENSKPELEHKHDSEAGSLRSEQTRSGRDDSYTKSTAEASEKIPKKIANDMNGFIERSIGMDIHPGLKPLSSRFSTDDLKITEDDIKEFIDNSDKFTLVDGKVHLKNAADPYTSTMAGEGTTTATSSIDIKGKGLPRRLEKGDRKFITQNRERIIKEKIAKATETSNNTKKVLPKLKEQKGYAAMNEPLNANKANDKTKKGKTKKAKDLNFSGIEDGREVRIGENAKKKRGLISRFRHEVVDRTSALSDIDKAKGDRKLQDKASGYFSSKARAMYQVTEGITDMVGNKVNLDLKGNVKGTSILDILNFKGDDSVLDNYLQNRFNVELATSGGNGMLTKDRWGFTDESAKQYASAIAESYPALAKKVDKVERWLKNGMRDDKTYQSLKKEFGSAIDDVAKEIGKHKATLSQNIVEKLEKDFPELKDIGDNWDTGWNAIMKEYAVKGGLINEKGLKNLYKHYFPGIRAKDATAGINSLDTPDVIKRIKGGDGTAMLTAKEQAAIMTNRVVSASYRNQIGLQILEDFEKNPNELKAFGRVIDTEGTDVADLDDAVSTIANTVEDIINGGKRLTVLKDGKKVTLEISEELADSLKAMYYAKDTNLISKAGKAITNPIKFGITTASMTFTPANMLRDMATALIQSEHSMGATVTGWGKALLGMTGANKKYAELYRKYIFGAGKNIDNYVQGSGFDTASVLETKGLKKAKNQIVNFLTFFGEKGETIPRFGEFLNTMEKTGDLERAIRDSKDVTVDFSKKGASEFVDTMNSWVMYLNAGIQGVDKFARTIKAHPVRTGGRALTVIGIPYMLCTLLNNDNPNYWDLTDRTRQQYFCIPNFFGDKDDDGNCQTFLRLPATREYGAILLASFDVAMRYMKGEENAGSGFAETLKEGFLPNDAVTDNILAPLLINIPTNKDYKGDKILTTAEEKNLKIGKYLDKQYNANTSNAAITISKGANALMGDKNIPILKYLKSPKLVDYMIDSYMGYYGSVLQSATSQSNAGAVDVLRSAALEPFENKFTADERYSSKVLSDSFDYYDELSADKTNAELDENDFSEAQAKYDAAKVVMDSIYDSIEVEKQIKVDETLSKTEKKEQIKELRDARIELAKSLEDEVEKAAKEYRESPTYSSLSKDQKEKWTEDLGIGKEEWAIAYNEKLKANRKKYEETGKNLTQDEIIYILQENGISTYEQAKSIDGSIGSTFYIDDEKGQKKWASAEEGIKEGRTFEDVQKETLEKYERQKDMSDTEIKIDNKLYSKYDGKTISKDFYATASKEFARVDRLGDNNGSIKQDEALNAIENLDKMYGLSQDEKAYLWHLAENESGWKYQPYGKWNG